MGTSVLSSRTLSNNGPNQGSVSMMPSSIWYDGLFDRFATPRTSKLQPGAVLATQPVQICSWPGWIDGDRNGGEKPRTSAGACPSKCSRKPGYCPAPGVSGSHSSTPGSVHNMSWPSQTTLKFIGRNT